MNVFDDVVDRMAEVVNASNRTVAAADAAVWAAVQRANEAEAQLRAVERELERYEGLGADLYTARDLIDDIRESAPALQGANEKPV